MSGEADHDALIQQFCSFTQASAEEAGPALASANWDVETAVANWFAAQEQEDWGSDADADMDDAEDEASADAGHVPGGGRTLGGGPASAQAGSSAAPASSSRSKQPQRGLRTLKDLQGDPGAHGHGHAHSDSDDDPNDQDYFAGGEKSGLAVQNPNSANPRDAVNSLLERARRNVARPGGDDEPAARPSRFTGRGVTLGGDDEPSRVIEDPTPAPRQRPPAVRRRLNLWQDGFSVDDGPLYRYDDPANAATLQQINSGRAPLDLLNVERGQEVDLELINQKDTPYVAPKKKYKAFSGGGNRLGSPTPGIASSSSSAAPAQVGASSSSASGVSPAALNIDSSQPVISLQIRLGDGTRLQSRFNTNHTIGDVYDFVSASSPASQQRPYALMTTFPSTELKDKAAQLGDLPEFKRGGVIVQKWL